jgi:hypothetical protein
MMIHETLPTKSIIKQYAYFMQHAGDRLYLHCAASAHLSMSVEAGAVATKIILFFAGMKESERGNQE